MAHSFKSVGQYTREIRKAKKQLAALAGLCISDRERKELKIIYQNQIITAIENRNTAQARELTVIDPEYL